MDLFYMMNPFDELLYSTFLKKEDINIWFSCISISFLSIPAKWKSFHSILNNIFLGNEKREEMIDVISKIQRTIHGMYRFKYLWRLRKAKLYNADDLYMNPIGPSDKGTVVIFENNTKYIFQLRELIRVVHSSLSNCCHFFPDPIQSKNPYTNLPFHKSNLYNIYFAVRSSQYRMPHLLEAFFREDFNLNRFLTKNEELINEEYLNTYVENNCVEGIFDYVQDMFKEHHIRSSIHPEFPKEKLYKIMKPYLSLYFVSNYSINQHKKARSFRLLHRTLDLFQRYNSCFGRRKIKFISKNPFSHIKQCIYIFDEKHPPFHNRESNHFLTSHLDSPDVQQQHHHVEEQQNDEDEDDDDTEIDDEDEDEDEDTEEDDVNAVIIVNHTIEFDEDYDSVD
jgi:hypothetical protein